VSEPILTDFSPSLLAGAIEASHWEYLIWRGRAPMGDLHESPELVVALSGVPDAAGNAIFRVRFPSDGLDARIETALEPVRERQLPLFWWIGPSTQPPELASGLVAHGLTHAASMPGMAADLHALDETLPRPSGLSIEAVQDAAGLATWCEIFVRASGAADSLIAPYLDFFLGLGIDLPGRYYLGYLNRDPDARTLSMDAVRDGVRL
jgi:hypothetical protein